MNKMSRQGILIDGEDSAGFPGERSPAEPGGPLPLDHDLAPHLPALAQCSSSRQLERCDLYRRLRPRIDRVLDSLLWENYRRGAPQPAETIRAVAWNVERGTELEGIIRILKEHPSLGRADLLLLTELDYGMARSRNLNVPQEIARALELEYVFAPCYLNLTKGSGLESGVEGRNRQALHGNALFSRHPLRDPCSIPLPNGKDKMKGNEKRLGCQRAVAAVVDHPAGSLLAVSVHLDAHASQRHRGLQMRRILDELDRRYPPLPVLIGGDWNTSTYDSRNAFFSIVGYARRVLMGVRNVLENHYPHPDRWFERHIFRELERRGYGYREFNEPGACTLHYHVKDLAANGRMADWIPGWCFWFINWALARNGGRCSMKLDWFAARGVSPNPGTPPRVVSDVHSPQQLLSDHDPIVVQVRLG